MLHRQARMRAGWVAACCTAVLWIGIGRGAHAATLTLRWTAPGDDGRTGRATQYDLRFSQVPITATNYWTMPSLKPPTAPAPAGQRDSLQLFFNHNGQPWYFAMRSADERGNWSAMSNVLVIGGLLASDLLPPAELAFSAPAPNPARARSTLRWTLPQRLRVGVEVLDAAGRRVRELVAADLPAGEHAVEWDLTDRRGARVRPGTYFVHARAGDTVWVRRLVVVY